MSYTRLTTKQIKEQIITDILALESRFTALADFSEYSRIRNMVFALTNIIDVQQDYLETIYNNIWVLSADEDGLEKHLADNGLTWGTATHSTVTVRIGSTTVPSEEITIPQLFLVSTSDTEPKIFRTLESVSIDSGTSADGEGYYTTEVLAESVDTGADQNVAINSINTVVTSIAGIDVVYNESTASGGQDRESITSVRNRLVEKAQVFDRGTKAWFINEAKNFEYVKDAYVYAQPYGSGTVLLTVAGFSYITNGQLTELQNHFIDESIDDAGAYSVTVDRVSTESIDIEMTVYRLNTSVTNTVVNDTAQQYFNDEMLIGMDFVKTRLIAYLIENIDSIYDIEITTPVTNIEITGEKTGFLNSLIINFIDVSD